MATAKSYFSLLSRDDKNSPWGVEFGAYTIYDCRDELADYRDHGHKAGNLKIVRTTDVQSDIDAAVAGLNAHLQHDAHVWVFASYAWERNNA